MGSHTWVDGILLPVPVCLQYVAASNLLAQISPMCSISTVSCVVVYLCNRLDSPRIKVVGRGLLRALSSVLLCQFNGSPCVLYLHPRNGTARGYFPLDVLIQGHRCVHVRPGVCSHQRSVSRDPFRFFRFMSCFYLVLPQHDSCNGGNGLLLPVEFWYTRSTLPSAIFVPWPHSGTQLADAFIMPAVQYLVITTVTPACVFVLTIIAAAPL